ncbi:MAG: phage holin family protein, partial [Hymenobacteraceae bacterium]|nr:phage holin family protein [Hymenobacteraceae bacterium]MDX5510865.1 phage holin family protein [Hymenobacteraceae bacterium]
MLIFLQPGMEAVLQLFYQFFETYIFSDWGFAIFLGIAIMLDTVTGVAVAWVRNRIHSKSLRKQFCEKVFQYAVGLIIVHGLAAHTVDGLSNPAFAMIMPYFKGFMYMLFIGAEALSVDENMGKLGRPFLPKFFRKRM